MSNGDNRPVEEVENSEEEEGEEEEEEDENEEDYCTACLEFMSERRHPPSCAHEYCVRCFYLLISRRTNCLICNVPIYDIKRVFRDLRSRVNIEANKRPS
uniref:RING-type domain-containing protein n=1 Tax=Caenorhabditis tropicalis TaxID=1561998 RepID=A0A1I7TW97_9PELO